MGQFKPMVKMMTTEPTVELKLKKGGSVAHKKMKSGGTCKMTGHKMMDGGMAPTVGTPMGGLAPSAAPAKPSMAARRMAMAKAMKGSRGMKPRATPPKGAKVVMPAMKEGGETKAEHKSEMKKLSGLEQAMKSHEGKPASKAHKGLKTGGVVKGQGGYKTGGVVKGQCGYAEGGIIKSTTGKTKVVTATPDNSKASTGDVKLGNGGGYKKGGSTKKFAEGGSVQDDGRPQKMAQGAKKPSSAVAINQLSGTFKKGGTVGNKKLQAVFKKENAPAMKAAKADSDLKYSKYQKKMADGGALQSVGNKLASMPKQPMSKPSSFKQADDLAYLNNRSSGMRPPRTNPLPIRPTKPTGVGLGAANPASTGLGQGTSTTGVSGPSTTDPRYLKKGGKAKKYADGGSTFDEGFASPSEQLAEMRKRKQMEEGYAGTRERDTASNEALLDSLTSLPASVKAMVRKALRGQGAVTDTETTVSRTVTPPAKKRGGKVRK